MKIVVTTDDFTPLSYAEYKKYWQRLKRKHRQLKLTAFITAHWKGDPDEFFNGIHLPSWIEPQCHGLWHINAATRSVREIEQIYKTAIGILDVNFHSFGGIYGLKPPGWQFSREMATALGKHFNWVVLSSGIRNVMYTIGNLRVLHDLGSMNAINYILTPKRANSVELRPRIETDGYLIINSHTNCHDTAPDSINDKTFYQLLDYALEAAEEQGWEYATCQEIYDMIKITTTNEPSSSKSPTEA